MPAILDTAVTDAALDKIATGTALHIVTGTPTTRAAVLTASLATVALAPADFVKSNATPDGRRVTVAAKTGLSVTAAGTPTHYAIIDATLMLARVEATGPALTTGSTTSTSSFPIEVSGAPVNI